MVSGIEFPLSSVSSENTVARSFDEVCDNNLPNERTANSNRPDSPARSLVQPSKILDEPCENRLQIHQPLHWALMLMLPCEHFVKVDREEVWKDTARKAKAISKEHWKRKDPTVGYEKMLQDAIKSIRENGGIIPRNNDVSRSPKKTPLYRLT